MTPYVLWTSSFRCLQTRAIILGAGSKPGLITLLWHQCFGEMYMLP